MLAEERYSAGINALARFESDALDEAGATHVIVIEGINDIGYAGQNSTPTAEDIIAGYKQLIEFAHTRGLKIYGATLTPFDGANYFTREGEAKREAINQWIKTSKAYDAVIDFDLATRDPPTRQNSCRYTTRETTCTRTMQATRRWPMPSTSRCSTHRFLRAGTKSRMVDNSIENLRADWITLPARSFRALVVTATKSTRPKGADNVIQSTIF